MSDRPASPRINACSWGRLEIEGHGSLRDAKLWPGGAREWDWNETGTRHEPGIQPADVAELVEHGATTVILSTGVYEMLEICPATLQDLAARGVAYRVLPTPDAVAAYNELCGTAPVGALIHSTC